MAQQVIIGESRAVQNDGAKTVGPGTFEVLIRKLSARVEVSRHYEVDVFNGSQDDVHVNRSMKPSEEKYRSLIAQIQAGNAPEVVGFDVIYLPRFVQLETLADLDSVYEGLEYTDDIFEPLSQDFIRLDDTVYPSEA